MPENTKKTLTPNADIEKSPSTLCDKKTTPPKSNTTKRAKSLSGTSDKDNDDAKKCRSSSPGKPSATTAAESVIKKAQILSSSSQVEAEALLTSLKRRKIKVAGAPKMPLTGYVRYMNDRREQLKREFPTKTSLEITRIICEEWAQLADERKLPYLKSAAEERQRYLDELNRFLEAHPEILASELAKTQQSKKSINTKVTVAPPVSVDTNANASINTKEDASKKPIATKVEPVVVAEPKPIEITPEIKRSPTPIPPNLSTTNVTPAIGTNETTVTTAINTNTSNIVNTPANNCNINGFNCTQVEIPIFTNDFLEHNKNFDLDFRTVRKQRSDLEQQNSVLDLHVENTRIGLNKINAEIEDIKEQNRQLSLYLEHTKLKLATALSTLSLSNEPNGANLGNIERFLDELYEMASSNAHGPCLNKARDIIRKLDLAIKPKY